MTRICHLFEPHAPDDTILAAHLMTRRLAREHFEHRFVRLDGRNARETNLPDVHRIPWRFGLDFTVGPRLRRYVEHHRIDMVHAWGLDALTISSGALSNVVPIAATLTHPPRDRSWSRWFQAVATHATPAVATPSGIVQRRAIEAGLDPNRTVVIRPGIDFHALHEAKRLMTRDALDLPEDAQVLVTLPTPSRAGGHFLAAWAAAMLCYRLKKLRVLIPGVSAEQRRLKRFADSLNIDGLFTFTDQRHAFGDLLAVADLVVVAAVDDVPAVPLGWAMAAGRPIVGSAVPAVTEFIADRSNGLLCKPGQPVLLAARIRTALNDPRLSARLADTARSQAFEVFSMRRNADQYRLFYENILADRSPGENIRDTAIK